MTETVAEVLTCVCKKEVLCLKCARGCHDDKGNFQGEGDRRKKLPLSCHILEWECGTL